MNNLLFRVIQSARRRVALAHPLSFMVIMPPLNIAVIGSGISGLSAAWLLSKRHKVTLFEQDHRLGGHTHTSTVLTADGAVPVDTGFIVFN